MMIEENLNKVLERIEKACQRSQRSKEEIQLVAVTKTVPVESIAEAVRCGVQIIGENKVQESQDKFQNLHASFTFLKWHMLGHLQTNKVNRAVEIFDCIQSVDSIKLIDAINRRASELNKIQDCLVEVKVSEEPTKYGLSPENLKNLLDYCQSLKNIKIQGLMIMAPFFEDVALARPYFTKARKLFEKFFISDPEPRVPNPVLSMGMSSDFEIAIEEGSSMVRIGTAIFGSRTAGQNI